MVPKHVRTDWPSDLEAGEVIIDWGPGGFRDPARAKDVLVAIVAGASTEGPAGWTWENFPIDPFQMAEGGRGDALSARTLVEHFGFDRVEWCHVLWKAEQLCKRRHFRRLVVRIADELERVEVLYADDLRADGTRPGSVDRMTAGLEHKTVEAQTHVANDLGEFSAFAATYDVDRVKDRIRFGAFENTIARWRASGKRVPVHWVHRGEAKNVIGSVDPAKLREVAGLGLYIEGKLDLDESEVAREAWRSMKDNRVGLSFGYMTVKSRLRDEFNDLLELDLYEISIAPGPINPQTRILEMKSAALAEREQADLRRRCDALAVEVALGSDLYARLEAKRQEPEPEAKSVPTDAELREQCKLLGFAVPGLRRPQKFDAVRAEARDLMLACLRGDDEQVSDR